MVSRASLMAWGLCAVLATATATATAAAAGAKSQPALNSRPIIGVLSMEVEPTPLVIYGNYSSHIAASYVKYLEGAGARVVPIMVDREMEYYQDLMEHINGVIFPGGPTDISGEAYRSEEGPVDPETSPYAIAGAKLFALATRANQQGRHLPLWATCIGFQLMSFLATGVDFRSRCAANNMMAPLNLRPGILGSQMFGKAPLKTLNTLRTQNVSAHFHTWCITEEDMKKHGMNWRVLSTNRDLKGMEFVSTMEARDMPFYGTIYHPEKIGYEWNLEESTPHHQDAVGVMQYFANFFVSEARRNSNRFPSLEAEQAALIYRHPITYTGDRTIHEQVYFFD